MKLTIVSVRIRDGSYLANSIRQLQNEGYDISVEDYDYGDIDNNPDTLSSFLDSLDSTDFLYIWVSGNLEYFKNYSIALKKASRMSIPTFIFNASRERADEHRGTFPYPDPDYEILYNYALLGGSSNFRGIGFWILNNIAGEKNELLEPQIPPGQGVYKPGCTDVSFETHIP